jgi:DNA-binding beta-propeller fold protein YncE
MAKNQAVRAGTVETICGGERFADGTPATDTWIGWPFGVAIDQAGNLYFSDKEKGRVFVRRKDGKLNVAAGTGVTSFSGDGGPATAACLHQVHGLAVDAKGNLYICDAGNRRIRRVDSKGVITTLIGTGERASLPLHRFPATGLPASEVTFVDPLFMTFDASGLLWISDTVAGRVYAFDPITMRVRVALDSSQGGPVSPGGVAMVDDRLFVIDRARKWIMTMDGKSGRVEGWLGGMKHEPRCDFADPWDLVSDGKGFLYVSDNLSHQIIRIEISTKRAEVYAGSGFAPAGGKVDGADARKVVFENPTGLAMGSDGTLYVSDWYSDARGIRAIKPDRSVVKMAGTQLLKPNAVPIGDGGLAREAQLHFPRGVAVDKEGNIYISDSNHLRVRKIDRATGIIDTVLGTGRPDGGKFGGDPKQANVRSPRAIAFDRQGNLFVVDVNAKGVLKLDKQTNRVDWLIKDARLQSPMNLALGLEGEVYLSDSAASVVWRVDPRGGLSVFAGSLKEFGFRGDGGPAEKAILNGPRGIAVGNDGAVYISDTGNHRIRVVRSRIISTFAGTGVPGIAGIDGAAAGAQLNSPGALAFDEAGNLLFTDCNYRICMIEMKSGLLRHVAGRGYGFGGNGGPAKDAQFNQPHGLAVWKGDLYIADDSNHAVRKVSGVS